MQDPFYIGSFPFFHYCSCLLCHRLSVHPHVAPCASLFQTSAHVGLLINHHNHDTFTAQRFDCKAKDIFPGSFTWIYLIPCFRWHSRTLGDFDLHWTLAFHHGGKWVSTVHTWTFSILPSVFKQQTFTLWSILNYCLVVLTPLHFINLSLVVSGYIYFIYNLYYFFWIHTFS